MTVFGGRSVSELEEDLPSFIRFRNNQTEADYDIETLLCSRTWMSRKMKLLSFSGFCAKGLGFTRDELLNLLKSINFVGIKLTSLVLANF